MRVIDAVRETTADVSRASPSTDHFLWRRASARNVSYFLPNGVYDPHQHSVNTPVFEVLAARPLPGGHFRIAPTVSEDESTGDRGGKRSNQGNPGDQQKVDRSDKRRIDRGRDPQRPLGGFNTTLTAGVSSCRHNHPPWACKEFR